METAYYRILLHRFAEGTASENEMEELFEYGRQHSAAFDTLLTEPELEDILLQKTVQGQVDEAISARVRERLLTSIHTPVHRIHFLKTTWFRYAAILLLIAGTATYLYVTSNSSFRRNPGVTANHGAPKPQDIAPGGNKAILTLSDGTTITLDSAANGAIAQQGNSSVVKLANGQIAYNPEGTGSQDVLWNTMSTPKGGQYQLVLPDGSKAWLNAASSITYPTAFNGKDRPVKVSGEVYFEVAKNKHQPFIVDIDGKSSIEVLGTSFNINSYTDEELIKTTLIEGSIKVATNNQSTILKPGQQSATGNTAAIQVSSAINLDQTLAWKNGLFNFNGSDLRSVMRQLERWYDIKVQYEGAASNDIFQGKIYRNVPLSEVLDIFREMDVKFKIEDKTLIIL